MLRGSSSTKIISLTTLKAIPLILPTNTKLVVS